MHSNVCKTLSPPLMSLVVHRCGNAHSAGPWDQQAEQNQPSDRVRHRPWEHEPQALCQCLAVCNAFQKVHETTSMQVATDAASLVCTSAAAHLPCELVLPTSHSGLCHRFTISLTPLSTIDTTISSSLQSASNESMRVFIPLYAPSRSWALSPLQSGMLYDCYSELNSQEQHFSRDLARTSSSSCSSFSSLAVSATGQRKPGV